MLATQKALPWGGRREDRMNRQASVGKDAAGGHACATKKPILCPDFELGPASGFS